MPEDIPRLRTDLDIVPTYYQGERAFLVKDHLGLIQQPILLRGDSIQLIQLVDGRRTIRDIQYEIIRARNNVFVSIEAVERLLAELDGAYLLDSESYREKRQGIVEEYNQQTVRKAFLAGRSYPKEKNALCSFLASFFPETQAPAEAPTEKVLALVSPHIDLEAGKEIYVKAYTHVRAAAPERIILLGTGHNLQDHFFSLTQKNFETPLGRVKTHKEWVNTLKEAGAELVSPDDFVHRSEHSLEFQLLFLQYLFGSDFSLIPVLCGSFQEVLGSYSRPKEIPGFTGFLDRLREAVADCPDTLVVAGVDFSHIGPKFGDEWSASALIQEARNHDTRLLESLCRADITAFWTEVQKVNNKYNVCGFSTLAVLLELLQGARGELLGYDFWQEEATRSAVSFAAIALTQNAKAETLQKKGVFMRSKENRKP